MRGVRRIAITHGPWLAVSFVVAFAVAAVVGYWAVVLGYTAFNGAGAVIYVDGLDPRQASDRRRGRVVASLTALLVPAGVVGLLASTGGVDPIDRSLGDEAVRNQLPAANLFGRGRGDGRF